jgi:hypothetical protein
MKTRTEVLKWVCDQFESHGQAVELGVKTGEFSQEILSHWRGSLHMIDAWRHFPSGYDDIANVATMEHFHFMGLAVQKIMDHRERAIVTRALGFQVARTLKEEQFDWVYIDAAHDEENVLHDLYDWWPLVKKGGILWGDDYLEGRFFDSQFGVKSALARFFEDSEYEIFHNEKTSEGIPQWWVIK